MARLDKDRQEKLEPKRMEEAIKLITSRGYQVDKIGDTELNFIFKGNLVKFYAYSGWATGKSIRDGRGILKLINQIGFNDDNQKEDLDRLYEWLIDKDREPAQTKFTAGKLRNVAKEIEFQIKNNTWNP